MEENRWSNACVLVMSKTIEQHDQRQGHLRLFHAFLCTLKGGDRSPSDVPCSSSNGYFHAHYLNMYGASLAGFVNDFCLRLLLNACPCNAPTKILRALDHHVLESRKSHLLVHLTLRAPIGPFVVHPHQSIVEIADPRSGRVLIPTIDAGALCRL